MKAETANLLAEALEAIDNHFWAIEAGKSEKWIHETSEKITAARVQLLKEELNLPDSSTGV